MSALLYLIILLAPLPLGSNRPLPEALLASASAIALIGWGWRGPYNLPLKAIAPITACFSAVLLWCGIELLWASDSSAALLALMRLATYFALFMLALQLGRSYRTTRHILKLTAFSAGFYAVYGLVVYALGNDHILWLEKWAYPDSLTGTFVNRNAFAAYAGMGLFACLALLAHTIGRDKGNMRMVFKSASTTFWLAGIGALALTLALVLTNSRAGILSVSIGMVVLWLCLYISSILPRRLLLGLGFIGLLLAAGAIYAVGPRLMQRAEGASFMQDDRPQIWLATLQMIKAKPLTGFGPGSYGQMFLQYRTPEIKQNYTKAHSTYLQMAAETGIPCTLVFVLGYGFIALFLLRGLHIRRQHKIYPALGLAVLTQAGAHSLVDFSFQTPANAALLAVMLGTCVAQSFSSEQNG